MEWCKRKQSARKSGWEQFEAADITLPAVPSDLFDLKSPFTEEEITRWSQVYRDARSGCFRFLGQSWPAEQREHRFSYDPASGLRWPTNTYCFDIPYRHPETHGDVKYVWEINRLQYLQPIALLGYATNDLVAKKFCITEILTWCDHNPPFKGVAWSSGIELAIRAISILLILPFINDSLTDRAKGRLIACLNAHLYWLARFPSRFSSANNHLIAEAAALGIAGALWRDHPRAAEYLRYGRETLENEALLQIHPDGVGAEQSPTYQAFTLEFLLLAIRVFDLSGVSMNPSVKGRLRASLEHFIWLMDGSGGVPRIGDDDEGIVVRDSMGSEHNYVASIASATASVLGDHEWTPPGAPLHLRDRIFGRATGDVAQPVGARTFTEGGYTIFRDRINAVPIVIVFDHAPLGYLSIAAHGHADALAFWMAVGNQQIVIDAGTLGYHGANEQRDAMRGTAAHNTVAIGDRNQSLITGTFNWRHHATSTLQAPIDPNSGVWHVTASHDGYVRSYGIVHERTLSWNRETATLTVEDQLSDRSINANARILFNPQCQVSETDDVVNVAWAGGIINISSTGYITRKIDTFEYSPSFGNIASCQSVTQNFGLNLTTEFYLQIY